MNRQISFTREFRVERRHRGRKHLREPKPALNVPQGTLPRVTRLMALAIRFEQLIREGVVSDQAELARLGHVTRARVTQIMNLLNLAPDIQEQILLLPRTESGRDPVSERDLRPIAAKPDWKKQRRMWRLVGKSRSARTILPLTH